MFTKVIQIKNRVIRNLKLFKIINSRNKSLKLYKNILGNKKINIYDIGAGQRILNELVFFDGISNIYLIDPNKNLEYSFNRLNKIFSNNQSIKKYLIGLSDKTQKINYYKNLTSTSSSFAVSKTKLKHFNSNFILKPIKREVFSFQDFIKKYNLSKPDIIKIDTEGFEIKILSSILKKNNPLIIQVETNLNNDVLNETFLNTQNLLFKKSYNLYTILPHYGYYSFIKKKYIATNKKVNLNDLEFNINKTKTAQIECYFIKKKRYTIKDIISLSAYGFNEILEEIYYNKKFNTSTTIKKIIERIFKVNK